MSIVKIHKPGGEPPERREKKKENIGRTGGNRGEKREIREKASSFLQQYRDMGRKEYKL